MRVAVLVVLLTTGLVFAVLSSQNGQDQVFAQTPGGRPLGQPQRQSRTDQLIALTSDVDESYQQVTLIDPQTRIMSVYHIDRRTGEIALKSVRNVKWDLQMEEFNGVSPSPRDIKSLLQQR